MRTPQRVVWSEGMLMSPQHLQQQDLYHEGHVSARLAAIGAESWGCSDIQIDESALASGNFSLTRFRGVLPDGTPVSFDARQARSTHEVPASKRIELDPSTTQTAVYLGLPTESDDVANYTRDGDRNIRHTIYSRPVRDQAPGPGGTVSVEFAARNLEILFDYEKVVDNYIVVQIAEVMRRPDDRFELDPTFVPPCLSLRASSYLQDGISRLLASLVSKYEDLAAKNRIAQQSHVDLQADDFVRFLQLSTVAAAMPTVRYLSELDPMPAREAYLHLSQLAAQLMAHHEAANPSQLPAFRYTDLRYTFGELFRMISEVLSARIAEKHVNISLDHAPDGVRSGRLSPEAAQCTKFVLCVRGANLDPEQIERDLPRGAKISTPDQIRVLMKRALQGVRVAATQKPPRGVPMQPGIAYFVLDTRGPNWQTVVDSRTIALYLPKPFDARDGVEVRLLATS